MLDAGSTSLTCFTLYPAFALVSMNITFSSLAFLSPSSMDTCLGEDNTESEKKKQTATSRIKVVVFKPRRRLLRYSSQSIPLHTDGTFGA